MLKDVLDPLSTNPFRGKRDYPLPCNQQNMLSIMYVAKRLNILNHMVDVVMSNISA